MVGRHCLAEYFSRDVVGNAAYGDLAQRMLAGSRLDSVADIGTGTGDLARAVCDVIRPDRMLLVDTSTAMLAAARQKLAGHAPYLRARTAALCDLDARGALDLVLAGHLIEHLPDPETGLHQLASLVKPGGTLVLAVSRPHWCQWFIWLRWRH